MSNELEAAAIEVIRAAVAPAAAVVRQLPEAKAAGEADAIIRLPNGIEVAIQLERWARASQRPVGRKAAIVWILERSSADFRRRLREEDQNFVDLSGSVRLHFPGLLIDRSDLGPIRRVVRRQTRNPFSDRASRIARTLFGSALSRSWSVQELASAAGTSLGAASYVINALAERELIEVVSSGREKRVRLSDRRSLVLQWSAEYTWRRNRTVTFEAPVGDPGRFLRRLPRMLEQAKWALTLQAGASLVEPHARWDVVHIYVGGVEPGAAGVQAGWIPSDRGKVVLLAPYYADSVWFDGREVGGLPVVSDLQLILDLWHYPVRGREQAEVLLERYAKGDEDA